MNILKLVLFLSFTATLFAQKVNVSSTSMTGQDSSKGGRFIGNAKVVQGKSWIHGDEIIVYFDENNETKKYEAIGNVTFEFDQEKSCKSWRSGSGRKR